jgi:hypothetical protein
MEQKKSQRDLRPWVHGMGLASPFTDILYPTAPDYYTFFKSQDNPTSRIDHVFHSPLPDDWALVELGVDNHITLAEFDHRPVWAGFRLPSKPTPTPLIRFRVKPLRVDISFDDPAVLEKYATRVDKACAREVAPLIDSDDAPLAARLLSVLHHVSIDIASRVTNAKR